MNKLNSILCISLIFIFQSCLFGVGLVEREITDDYWLIANGKMDEMSIVYFPRDKGSELIVNETVFAVGYNDNFILAKSHPNGSKANTYYHIIEINKNSNNRPEQAASMTFEQYELKKEQLKIPSDLDFSIVYKELE